MARLSFECALRRLSVFVTAVQWGGWPEAKYFYRIKTGVFRRLYEEITFISPVTFYIFPVIAHLFIRVKRFWILLDFSSQ